MRRQAKFRTIAAILGIAMLSAAVGCGGDGGEGSIGEQDATQLRSLLDEIEASVDSESCDTATAAAGSFEAEVTNLTNVPEDVVDDLLGAGERLQQLVIQECGDAETDTDQTSTTTRTREEDETDTSTSTTTTTTTVPTTTETTTAETTTETTTNTDTGDDDDDTGGTPGAGGAVAPPAGGGGGEK